MEEERRGPSLGGGDSRDKRKSMVGTESETARLRLRQRHRNEGGRWMKELESVSESETELPLLRYHHVGRSSALALQPTHTIHDHGLVLATQLNQSE